MKLGIFCWHDKVDGVYMPDSVMVDRSKRAVCRGYLQAFEQNKKLNFKEYELCQLGTIDDETGVISANKEPEVIDPKIVYAQEDLSDNKPHDL